MNKINPVFSSIIPNTNTLTKAKSNDILLPFKPNSKRDLRNEVPIKHFVYRNDNLTTIARNYDTNNQNTEEKDNFSAHFFMNSIKKLERDNSKEIREKLIEEYKKETPNAFVLKKSPLYFI